MKLSINPTVKFAGLMAALAVPMLVACAVNPDAEPRLRGAAAYEGDPRLGEKVDNICFASGINGFSNNENGAVVLHRGVSDDYLVEVFGGCFDLENAMSVGIDSVSSCVTRGDDLIFSDSAFSLSEHSGIGPQRCSISAIYKWDAKADKTEKASDEDSMAGDKTG